MQQVALNISVDTRRARRKQNIFLLWWTPQLLLFGRW